MGSSERDVTILFLLASNILSSTRQNFLNWQQRSFYFFLLQRLNPPLSVLFG